MATAEILGAVAETQDCDILDLPPLGYAIDADALERLVASLEPQGSVQFSYCSCRVRVRGDGEATILDADGSPPTESR